ncbi:MAG: MotA/TolQ/ExbB proton channel family protein [Paludibacter sp.]|jgi:biopolymer transport protein ExbB|nr:MotA/TolQ/ExbB proton channel family protein [Paludibacter sp.]
MILLQISDNATQAVVQTTQTAEKMNLWDMAVYGGPIMIVLAAMLALGIYLFIERLVTIKNASQEDKSFMNRIKENIQDGKIDSAIRLCKDQHTPSARMIEKGISRLGRPLNDVMVAVENVGNLEVAKLEKGLVVMASISGGAPMLGFLGTVTGMVLVFFNMSNSNGGSIVMSDLSSGMYQAMVTTVGGLIVGILAYFAYNYLISLINSVVRTLEATTMEFMDILNEPAK